MADLEVTKENVKDIARLQAEMVYVKESIAELRREQRELRDEQQTGFEKVLLKIDALSSVFVKKDIYEMDLSRIKEERFDRTDTKKWLWRAVGAVLIGIIVSAIINIFIHGLIGELGF